MTHGEKRRGVNWMLPLVTGLGLSGLLWVLPREEVSARPISSTKPTHPPRTWVNPYQEQSIELEFPQFPGNVFKIAIPEVVSDAEGIIVPWREDPAHWEFSKQIVRWSTTISARVYMEAEVEFKGSELETRVKLRNLSSRTWRETNAFTCLTYADAPLFNDPSLRRTFVPTGDWRSRPGWKPLAELFAAYNPGRGNYTFFPVAGRSQAGGSLGGPPSQSGGAPAGSVSRIFRRRLQGREMDDRDDDQESGVFLQQSEPQGRTPGWCLHSHRPAVGGGGAGRIRRGSQHDPHCGRRNRRLHRTLRGALRQLRCGRDRTIAGADRTEFLRLR